MSNPHPVGSFKKGQSGNPGGRKPKSVHWKQAEEALREALPRILMMKKSALQKLLANDPTGVEMLAYKYVLEHETETVNRFLGKTPDNINAEIGGRDGSPIKITFDPGTD